MDDKTSGKLPDVYTEHPTYRRLFGASVSSFIAQIRVIILMGFPVCASNDQIDYAWHALCNEV